MLSEFQYKRICYYTNWAQYRPGFGKFTPQDIDPFLCTHLVYAYVTIDNSMLKPSEWNDDSTPEMKGMYVQCYSSFIVTTGTELTNTSFTMYISFCTYSPLNPHSRCLRPHLYCRTLSSSTVVLVSLRLVLSGHTSLHYSTYSTHSYHVTCLHHPTSYQELQCVTLSPSIFPEVFFKIICAIIWIIQIT